MKSLRLLWACVFATGMATADSGGVCRRVAGSMCHSSDAWRIVVILLVSNLVAAGLAMPSQIGAPSAQAAVPRESVAVAQSWLERGDALSEARNYTAAIAAYNIAIELKPDFAEAYNNRGFAHYLNKDAERAIADFTRAIELRPNYPKAYNSRGVVYMANGYGSSKAIADFDRAIALKPDFRYAYINRANARLGHPWLPLRDFHQAGMYPERIPIGVAAVVLTVGFAVGMRRRSRRQKHRA